MIDTMLGDWVGYLAAALVFLTFCMKRMLSLRIVAIAGNLAFVLYGLTAGLIPILVLHALLLPLNIARLVQLVRATRQARRAASSPSVEGDFRWLIPHATIRRLADGETLFRKGDRADGMFVIDEGVIDLPEIGASLGKGALLGEIGLLSPMGRRMASAKARGPVTLGEITGERLRELYFDNPEFAYSLIRVVTRRLLESRQDAQGDRL